MPDSLCGDSVRLRQILVNLVGNAVKFTETGEVSILVEEVSRTTSVETLTFRIRDSGIGISRENQTIIFEPFSQGDSSATRKFGGTGLGLAITSQLITLMGGSIEVESPSPSQFTPDDNSGTTFRFTLDFGYNISSSDSRSDFACSLEKLQVAVADDSDFGAQSLSETLSSFGTKVACFRDGQTALDEILLSINRNAPFDLVLVDASMPGMDGFGVVERLSELTTPVPAVIMMLSCIDIHNQVARCRELGFKSWLINPFRPSELVSAFNTAMEKQQATAPDDVLHSPSERFSNARRLQILLTEDNRINQQVATHILENAGHSVVLAENGESAIKLLAERTFDAILMDVQMPEMNGFDATSIIRRNEALSGRHTPIIAMTAYAMTGDRERYIAAGMDGYISKPIRIEELLRTIEDLVAVSRDPDGSERTPNLGPAIEIQAFVSRTNGDEELARELVRIFVDDSRELLLKLRRAVDEGDCATVERDAHTIKGMLGYFSDRTTLDFALQLQTMGAKGDIADAPSVLLELEQSLNSLRSSLTSFLRENF